MAMECAKTGRTRFWLPLLWACGHWFAVTSANVETSIVTASDASECPIYRFFDNDNPNSPQYGAPNGCRCVDGMQGITCGFCDSDTPCQAQDKSDGNHRYCRKGVVFAEGDTYKAYKCSLFSTLESLFNNGKVDIVADMMTGTGSLVVYNTESVNDGYAIECQMSECDFPVGGTIATCASAGMCF